MPVLETVVADIRPGARRTLVRRLSEDGRFAIAGVFSSWTAGVAAVRRRSPRVAFLPLPEPAESVRLPRAALADTSVVLIGADRALASTAFDLGATDFLVRPLRPPRVGNALRRLYADLARAPGPGRAAGWWRFSGKDGEFLLPLGDVRRLEATHAGTDVHTASAVHRTPTPLGSLVPSLARRGFVLVSPRQLVRRGAVRELRRITPDTWDLILEGGDRVRTSPNARDEIAHLMETLGALAIH